MYLNQLPKGSFAIISDQNCWADKMFVYRDSEGRLFVFDTDYRGVREVTWEQNERNLFSPGIDIIPSELTKL